MIIENDTTLSNVCNNDITVSNCSTLTIKGICSKTVLVKSECTVIVTGICHKLELLENSSAKINGTVHHLINHGNIYISGTVKQLDDLSKNTVIEPGSIVNNVKH